MVGERLTRPQPDALYLGPSRLPALRTALVGRDEDLAASRALLMRPDVRLVTFTGAGGTGKTRLALQVAADTAQSFPGGVFFVALASITDAALVLPTIARTIGAREIGSREPMEA